MNQNTNISQANRIFPLSVVDLQNHYQEHGIEALGVSFYATAEEISSVNTPGCTDITGHSIHSTSRGLVGIALILLDKIEAFLDIVRVTFPKNTDFQEIDDLCFYLAVALHDLNITTLNDELKGNLAYGITVVAKDFSQLIQSIPNLLKSISKENANA